MQVSGFNKLLVALPLVAPISSVPIVSLGSDSHLTVGRIYGLLVIVVLGAVFLYRKSTAKPNGVAAMLSVVLLLYGVLLGVSVYWAADIPRALEYTAYYLYFILLVFIVLGAGLDKRFLDKSINAWVWMAAGITLLCVVEILFEVRFSGSRYYADESPYFFHPTGFFHNENDLAVYLGISSVFVFWKAVPSTAYKKFFWLSLFALMSYVVVKTASRGGLVLIFLGFFLSVAGLIFINKDSFFRWVLLGCLIFFIIFVFWGLEEVFGGFVHVDFKDEPRLALLRNAANGALENFGLGVGAGNIEVYMQSYDNVRVLNVHNWLGEVAGNAGILGLGLWVFFLVVVFFALLSTIIRDKDVSGFRFSLLVLLGLFPLWQSIISSVNQFFPFWLLVMYWLVYINSVPRGYRSNRVSKKDAYNPQEAKVG